MIGTTALNERGVLNSLELDNRIDRDSSLYKLVIKTMVFIIFSCLKTEFDCNYIIKFLKKRTLR